MIKFIFKICPSEKNKIFYSKSIYTKHLTKNKKNKMGASKGISKKFETKRGPERKERKRKRTETFSKYIFRVLKQVHKDMGISKSSMSVMNSFIRDLFDQISLEASKLVRNRKVHTLTAKEIQSSVKLLLPGELAIHANIEGNKALNKLAQA